MAHGHGASRQSNVNESTPLLAGSNAPHIPTPPKPVPQKATPTPQATATLRPNLARAVTTAAALRASAPCSGTAPPDFSRPILNRAPSTSAVNESGSNTTNPNSTSHPGRTSLIRRATDILGLNATTSDTYHNAPTQPSHWTDHAHRKPLLQVWDSIHNAAAASTSKYAKSITAQLVATEKQMLQDFAELNEGDVLLTREWMEFVLGVCLRQPFCNADCMGRFEVLAASAGSRANWGPW